MNPFKSHHTSSQASIAGALTDPPIEEAAHPGWKERRSIVWEWSLALVLAFCAALLIRALFFEAFRIPSESMEETLLVGDFVLVSKLHYGPRLPITVGIPFTNLYLENVGLPSMRIPGFSEIKRNDVVVFNVPTDPYPVDRKTHYIKRVIGLPGDSLSIVDKVPHVEGEPISMKPAMKHMWRAQPVSDTEFPVERLRALGVSQILQPSRKGDSVGFEATQATADEVQEWPEVHEVQAIVRPSSVRSRVFPFESDFGFDNYGPLYVPKKGDVIALNETNWTRYRDIIRRYEGHQAREVEPGIYEIDGEIRDDYPIEQDYYFVMGDNRDSSLDSRAWGFVPYNHFVGKAVMVYFSWDANNGRARTERFMTRID